MVYATNPVVVYAAVADQEPAANRLTRKLQLFAELPVGWSFGEGIPVARDVIRIGEELLRWAEQLQIKADVFLGLMANA